MRYYNDELPKREYTNRAANMLFIEFGLYILVFGTLFAILIYQAKSEVAEKIRLIEESEGGVNVLHDNC